MAAPKLKAVALNPSAFWTAVDPDLPVRVLRSGRLISRKQPFPVWARRNNYGERRISTSALCLCVAA